MYELKQKPQANTLFRNVFYIVNDIEMNKESEKLKIWYQPSFRSQIEKNVIFPRRKKPMANKNISFPVSLIGHVGLRLFFICSTLKSPLPQRKHRKFLAATKMCSRVQTLTHAKMRRKNGNYSFKTNILYQHNAFLSKGEWVLNQCISKHQHFITQLLQVLIPRIRIQN